LYHKGYFFQTLDGDGIQAESPAHWTPDDHLRRLDAIVEMTVAGRRVRIGAWEYRVVGATGFAVPVIMLDCDIDGNNPSDRTLTDQLYGGDARYRLAQEMVLGVGGIRMLRALGYRQTRQYHLNEGHASLLILELLQESAGGKQQAWDFDAVRRS
jgi:starch phosphorylase